MLFWAFLMMLTPSCSLAQRIAEVKVELYLSSNSLHLEKAYDSVEFSVLLKRLFQVGVNSKTWRILRSWYTDGHSSVRLGQHVSPPFALGRGVFFFASGVNSVTSTVPAHHGPSPTTTTISIYWSVSEQHVCRWLYTCR